MSIRPHEKASQKYEMLRTSTLARKSAVALNASDSSSFDVSLPSFFDSVVTFFDFFNSFASGCLTISICTSTSFRAAAAFGFVRRGGGGLSSSSTPLMEYAKIAAIPAPAAARSAVRFDPLSSVGAAFAAAGGAVAAAPAGFDNGSRNTVPFVAIDFASANTDSCSGNVAAFACGITLFPLVGGGGADARARAVAFAAVAASPIVALYVLGSPSTDSCSGNFFASACGTARIFPIGGFFVLDVFAFVGAARAVPVPVFAFARPFPPPLAVAVPVAVARVAVDVVFVVFVACPRPSARARVASVAQAAIIVPAVALALALAPPSRAAVAPIAVARRIIVPRARAPARALVRRATRCAVARATSRPRHSRARPRVAPTTRARCRRPRAARARRSARRAAPDARRARAGATRRGFAPPPPPRDDARRRSSPWRTRGACKRSSSRCDARSRA